MAVVALFYAQLVHRSRELHASLEKKFLATEAESQRDKPPRSSVSPLSSASPSSSPLNPLDLIGGALPGYPVVIRSQRQLLASMGVILGGEPTTSRTVVGTLVQWRFEEGTSVARGDSHLGWIKTEAIDAP